MGIPYWQLEYERDALKLELGNLKTTISDHKNHMAHIEAEFEKNYDELCKKSEYLITYQ